MMVLMMRYIVDRAFKWCWT